MREREERAELGTPTLIFIQNMVKEAADMPQDWTIMLCKESVGQQRPRSALVVQSPSLT